ncbi:MAG: hypoxanthine phosphoribosyltransferase [Bacilli bacterium]|nr:hypoxanthine phosphoribosyltransferase [Bacilli bacterium]
MVEMVMSHEEILKACEDIAMKLKKRLENLNDVPLMICVMKGAINFMVELMLQLKMDVLTDYVQVRSWEGTSSTGEITFKRDVSHRIEGRTLIIVEDIIDSGITMNFLVNHFKQMGAKEIIVVALFDKICKRKVPIKIDFVGKTLNEDKFLVGYGLDYKGLLRNVPYVYVPSKEEIEKWDKMVK